MNQQQINSLIRTVLKIAGTALAAHGLSSSAALVNNEDMFGAIVLLVGLWQSHQTHADPMAKAIADLAAGPAHEDALSRINAELANDFIKPKGDGGNATPAVTGAQVATGAEPTAAPAHLPANAVQSTYRPPT